MAGACAAGLLIFAFAGVNRSAVPGVWTIPRHLFR